MKYAWLLIIPFIALAIVVRRLDISEEDIDKMSHEQIISALITIVLLTLIVALALVGLGLTIQYIFLP